MKTKNVQFILQTIYLNGKGKLAYLLANKHSQQSNFRLIAMDFINETIDCQLNFLGQNYQNCSSAAIQNSEELLQRINDLLGSNGTADATETANQDIVFYLGEYESWLFLSALKNETLAAKFTEFIGNFEYSFEIPLAGGAESGAATRFLKQVVALNEASIRYLINVYLDLDSYRKDEHTNEVMDLLQEKLNPIQELKFINNLFLFNRVKSKSIASNAIEALRHEGKSPILDEPAAFLTKLYFNKEITYITEPINPDDPDPMVTKPIPPSWNPKFIDPKYLKKEQ